MEERRYTTEKNDLMRIDKFLSEKLPDLSRSYLQKLIKEKEVLVNGQPVKANYKLSLEDHISVMIPELKEPDILPEQIPRILLPHRSWLESVFPPEMLTVFSPRLCRQILLPYTFRYPLGVTIISSSDIVCELPINTVVNISTCSSFSASNDRTFFCSPVLPILTTVPQTMSGL